MWTSIFRMPDAKEETVRNFAGEVLRNEQGHGSNRAEKLDGLGPVRNQESGIRDQELETGSRREMTNQVWKCEQFRAGQVTNRIMFDSKEQADEFVSKMQRVEPDIFWRIEPVEARMVWN